MKERNWNRTFNASFNAKVQFLRCVHPLLPVSPHISDFLIKESPTG